MLQEASDAGGKIGKTSEKAVLLADRLTGARGADTIGTDERNGDIRVKPASGRAVDPLLSVSHLCFSFHRKEKAANAPHQASSLQDGPPCPAGCPNLMIRGRLPHRSRAHRTDGSFSHPCPRYYPHQKGQEYRARWISRWIMWIIFRGRLWINRSKGG